LVGGVDGECGCVADVVIELVGLYAFPKHLCVLYPSPL
jgi:hypothetical protein